MKENSLKMNIGRQVMVVTPYANTTSYKGTLLDVDQAGIVLRVGDGEQAEVYFPFAAIHFVKLQSF